MLLHALSHRREPGAGGEAAVQALRLGPGVDEDHPAVWSQQSGNGVGQAESRLAEVIQDLGCEHEVERARRCPLQHVRPPEVSGRVSGAAAAGAGHGSRGNVDPHEFVDLAGGQEQRGENPLAAPDLEGAREAAPRNEVERTLVLVTLICARLAGPRVRQPVLPVEEGP